MEQPCTVYVLFSRSTTLPSRIIHFFTGGEFTHVSVGVAGPGGPFYTFARKYPRFPLPGGLIREVPGQGYFGLHPETLCCLFALPVEEGVYRALEARLNGMYRQVERYHYNLLGAITAYFHIPRHRERYYFCSQFVADALDRSGAAAFPKDPALAKPMEIYALMDGIEPVMRGTVGDLK